jgi:hypothetical protein
MDIKIKGGWASKFADSLKNMPPWQRALFEKAVNQGFADKYGSNPINWPSDNDYEGDPKVKRTVQNILDKAFDESQSERTR